MRVLAVMVGGTIAGLVLAGAVGYAVLCGWIVDRDWNQEF